jgi:hypothetical protein
MLLRGKLARALSGVCVAGIAQTRCVGSSAPPSDTGFASHSEPPPLTPAVHRSAWHALARACLVDSPCRPYASQSSSAAQAGRATTYLGAVLLTASAGGGVALCLSPAAEQDSADSKRELHVACEPKEPDLWDRSAANGCRAGLAAALQHSAVADALSVDSSVQLSEPAL